MRNNQENKLPFSVGGHPAFNWPLLPDVDKASHEIVFEKDEEAPLLQLEGGLLSETTLPSPIKNRKIALNESLFENDALIFDKLTSNQISYKAGEKCELIMKFNDFPQLGIWKKPGADFVCLEPWVGYASPKSFDGEFSEKPGIVSLPGFMEVAYSFDLQLNTRSALNNLEGEQGKN